MPTTSDPYKDTVCSCVHWSEEHAIEERDGRLYHECHAPDCDCDRFTYSEELSSAEAIFDRGGEHPTSCTCAACATGEHPQYEPDN